MSALEFLGHIGPVIDFIVIPRLAGWMTPSPGRLMGYEGHVECIEDDAFSHVRVAFR